MATLETKMPKAMLLSAGLVAALTLAVGLGNAQGNLAVPGSAPATAEAGPPTGPGALSAPAKPSRDQYCSAGNYLGHYYNYYYGNQDGREFYYFDRDWMSVCSK